MIQLVARNILGSVTMVLFVLNTILWFIPIMVCSVFKLLIPIDRWRVLVSSWLMKFGENWISFNRGIIALTQDIKWDFRGVDNLRRREWYLVVSNHQSWVDIVVLQLALNRRIPFLKFFIKQQLIWVPFLGLAWWAMDMPFMKRYSREFLAKHPHMRGRDLEATRKACEHFSGTPTSVTNFLEGTRFTEEKHRATRSPYKYLLQPRPGGAAFVLGALGQSLHALLDVTIVYPDGIPSMWDLCTRNIHRVVVDVRQYPVESWLLPGDYQADTAYRARFKERLRELWEAKDARISEMREELGIDSKGSSEAG
jgi:1-acyl-sn-glycerol-3-phosphate acyltransferase